MRLREFGACNWIVYKNTKVRVLFPLNYEESSRKKKLFHAKWLRGVVLTFQSRSAAKWLKPSWATLKWDQNPLLTPTKEFLPYASSVFMLDCGMKLRWLLVWTLGYGYTSFTRLQIDTVSWPPNRFEKDAVSKGLHGTYLTVLLVFFQVFSPHSVRG